MSRTIAGQQDSVDRFLPRALELYPTLDPEVEGAVDRMTWLVKHLDRVTERTVGVYGLNRGEFRLLLALRKSPEEHCSAGDLASRLTLSSGAMTNRLDRLEEANLITRERDPKDRRSVAVSITERGIEVVGKAVAAQAEEEKKLLAALAPDEQRRLNGLLRKLTLSIEPWD